MSINADGYLNHLITYLDTREMNKNKPHYGQLCKSKEREGQKENEIILADTDETTNERLKVKLRFSGKAFGIRLDTPNAKHFHFLNYGEDEQDPQYNWLKRCDFILFQSYQDKLSAYCIEFKKARTYIPAVKVMRQLHAGEAWCVTLHKLIAAYTNKDTPIAISKFVFTDCENPAPDLCHNQKYLKDYPDIRHYNFSEVNETMLEDLEHDCKTIIH
jgi:hypothetical protein